MYKQDIEQLVQAVKNNSLRISEKYNLNKQNVLEDIQTEVLDITNGTSTTRIKRINKHLKKLTKRTNVFLGKISYFAIANGYKPNVDIAFVIDYMQRYLKRKENKNE